MTANWGIRSSSGPTARAWVTDSGLDAIVRVDPATLRRQDLPLPASSRLREPQHGDVRHATGSCGSPARAVIYGRLDPKSGALRVFSAPLGAGPYGIATTPKGQVCYASLAGSHVARIDVRTGRATVLRPPTRGPGRAPRLVGLARPDVGERVERATGQGRRDARRRGAAPELEGRARPLRRAASARVDRRPVRRDEGADRRLLALAGEVDGRGDRVGQALPEPARRGRPRSRSARCSRPRTSATSSRPELREQEERLRAEIARQRVGRRLRRRRECCDRRRADADTHRAIDAVWRIESARLIAGLARHRARRRPGRGARAGRARRRARAVAGVGRPGQPGRLAHGHRQAPRDRPPAPQRALLERKHERARRASSSERAGAEPDLDAALDDDVGDDLLRLDLHRLPPGALDRGARRAHAAPARRPHDRGDRARVPRAGADDRAAHRARQADARRGARAVRGARAATSCAERLAVGARGDLPRSSTRATRPPPATTGCGRALCEEALRLGRILAELVPARARGARPRRADGDPGVAARARASARTGEPILLLDQDRGALGPAAHPARARGARRAPRRSAARSAPTRCRPRSPPATRARATPTETDWARIAALYDALAQRRAVAGRRAEPRGRASAMAFGPAAGLELVDALRRRAGARGLPPAAERARRPAREARPARGGARRVRARGGADPQRARARPAARARGPLPLSRRYGQVLTRLARLFVSSDSATTFVRSTIAE